MRAGRAIAAVLALGLALAAPAGAGESEQELGRRFLLEARSELPLVTDPTVNEYVDRIGRRLVATLGAQQFDFHFYVVQSPVLNAFAVPGGYVFVFSGLVFNGISNDAFCVRGMTIDVK